VLNLKHSSFATDFRPIDPACSCVCCRRPRARTTGTSTGPDGLGITRAYVHHLAAKETVGAHLLTMHNVHYVLALMGAARQAIVEDRYPALVRDFFAAYFADTGPPSWAVAAFRGVGIDLREAGGGS
jgi:queuine tRNA-ribosyltransferase catalytic subunit